MVNHEEKTSLCALSKIFGFDPKTALALISKLGCAAAAFRLSGKELDLLLGPYSKYRRAFGPAALDEASAVLQDIGKSGTRFVGWTEDGYPALLKECPDAPVGIYVQSKSSDAELWNRESYISVVGTRDVSPYGREWCEKIVYALSRATPAPAIVSGLAIGTDICAHKAAIEAGLPTIGVMATGPDSVYPYRHKDFAGQMCRTPGCALVTDYPPGTAPLPVNFLRRNRIIAGLSHATVLVESKLRGGGMMTCRLAFSYDRDVYALPGRADDIRSQGCNSLIKAKIAEPVTSEEELAESLGLCLRKAEDSPSDTELLLSEYTGRICGEDIRLMAGILSAVRSQHGLTAEELAAALDLPYASAANLAGLLEADGFMSSDLSGRYRLTIRKPR